jgi:tetraacyldisaccharide 4'-kinase
MTSGTHPRAAPLTFSSDYYRGVVRGELHGLWPGLLRGALRAASVPYGWAVRFRNALYDRAWKRIEHAAVPVVSIGNLTLGGTGKTPCVEYVAKFYRQMDVRVAILSRGYGANHGVNDEALVLEESLPDVPHLQAPDRAALAAIAVEELESELLILDDGFQHRRLARDLDIVLVDATDPWGQGCLFPRGLLREGRRSLRRAGVVVLTRCDQVDEPMRGRLREEVARWTSTAVIAQAVHQPTELVNSERRTASLSVLREPPVAAFCGIGNPEAFRRSLLDLGARMTEFRTFRDHYSYRRADVTALQDWLRKQPAESMAVTTEKDLVKLRVSQLGGRPIWALRVRLDIVAGQAALEQKLRSVLPTR